LPIVGGLTTNPVHSSEAGWFSERFARNMITRAAGVMSVVPQGSGGTRTFSLSVRLADGGVGSIVVELQFKGAEYGRKRINRTYHVRPGAEGFSENPSRSRKIDAMSGLSLEILGLFPELTFKNSGATPRPSVSMATLRCELPG
jgi:hypothetical protein